MFDKLYISTNLEREDFDKYLKIRGKFVFKQIYDYLLNFNDKEVKYSDLSSCIRYDKNLRDTLYIYLATFEECLRAKIFEKYDIESSFQLNRKEELYIQKMANSMYESKSTESSELYKKFSLDLGETILLVKELKMFNNAKIKEFTDIRILRNRVMHHNLLILGKGCSLKEIKTNKEKMTRGIIALANNLPEGYKEKFVDVINSLPCDFKQYKITVEA